MATFFINFGHTLYMTSFYTKTQSTQINQHVSHHLSQTFHLGTYLKTTMGTNRELTIYEIEPFKNCLGTQNIIFTQLKLSLLCSSGECTCLHFLQEKIKLHFAF